MINASISIKISKAFLISTPSFRAIFYSEYNTLFLVFQELFIVIRYIFTDAQLQVCDTRSKRNCPGFTGAVRSNHSVY